MSNLYAALFTDKTFNWCVFEIIGNYRKAKAFTNTIYCTYCKIISKCQLISELQTEYINFALRVEFLPFEKHASILDDFDRNIDFY